MTGAALDRMTSWNDGRVGCDSMVPHAAGLHSHIWDLEFPVGTKGRASGDKEEGGRNAFKGERAEVAAGVGCGGAEPQGGLG